MCPAVLIHFLPSPHTRSFIMNCQELATAAVEELNTKCFILNNQYLGMVMQARLLMPFFSFVQRLRSVGLHPQQPVPGHGHAVG